MSKFVIALIFSFSLVSCGEQKRVVKVELGTAYLMHLPSGWGSARLFFEAHTAEGLQLQDGKAHPLLKLVWESVIWDGDMIYGTLSMDNGDVLLDIQSKSDDEEMRHSARQYSGRYSYERGRDAR